MDRTKSVNFIIPESEICPWKSQDQDFYPTSIERQVKVINNKNSQCENIVTQQIKQARSEKFYKILQQHRQRLMRKKIHKNTQSLHSEQKIKIDKKPNIIIKRPETNPKSSKNLHIIALEKKSYTIMSRVIQESRYQNKCINPKLVNIYQYERDVEQLFYRPRSINKNADKFYGNLNKRDNLNYKYSSNIDFQKIHPLIGKTERLKQSGTYRADNCKAFNQGCQLKLLAYRSSRSVQKLRLKIQQKNRKKNFSKLQKSKMEQDHILDRILRSK